MDRPTLTFVGVLTSAAVLLASIAALTQTVWLALAAVGSALLVAAVTMTATRSGPARTRTPDDDAPEAPIPPTPALALASTAEVSQGSYRVRSIGPQSPTTAATSVVTAPATVAITAGEGDSPAQPPNPRSAPVYHAPVSSEPDDVLDALLAAIRDAGAPVGAALWLEDTATATMRLVAARGEIPPERDFERTSSSLVGQAVSEGTARFGSVTHTRIGGGEMSAWRLAVPIEAGDARGGLTIDLSGRQPDRMAITRAVAALRSSVSGALSVHVARIETRTAQVLVDAAYRLARLLDPEAVARVALEHAVEISCAQTASVMLLDPDGRLRITASRGLPAEVAENTVVAEGEGIAGWVVASKTHMVVEDLEGRNPFSRRHGIRSALSVPIADEDGLLGVLNVGSRQFQARFTQSHVKALEGLGRCTALALRNARASRATTELYLDTLKALALAMETKDPCARGGTDRVLHIVEALGHAFGLDDHDLRSLQIAAMLHDVGVQAAGDGATALSRPLSTVEWAMVKLHPTIAAEILEQAPALRDVVPIVYHHHERYDGSGYVAGLSGERIPLGSRILALADAWVAMTSERPFRPAMSVREALDELLSHSGTQFDPLVVDTFVRLLEDGAIASTASANHGRTSR